MNEVLTKSNLAQSRDIKKNGTNEEREQAQSDQIIRIGNMIVARARNSGVDDPRVNRTHASGGRTDELANSGYKGMGHDNYSLTHRSDVATTQVKGNFYYPEQGLDLNKRLKVSGYNPDKSYGDSIEINTFGSTHPNKPEGSPLQGKLNVSPEYSKRGVELSPDETVHAAAGILSNLRGEVADREIQLGMPTDEAKRADVDRILKT
ncbi:MAG TPA: hypothetical protein VLF88_03940 [Candidatus Babeliales bacterium]|nr:hypothetical protein [Candidatus Babeliales bacterium]